MPLSALTLSTASTLLRLTAFISLCLLSSCGFQLRGIDASIDQLPRVQLKGEGHTLIYQAVARQLRISGNPLVEERAQAIIELRSGGIRRRSASLNERGKTEEYELLAHLRFEIFDTDGHSLSEPVEIESSRTYLYDENNVNAMQAEERLLKQELRTELADQVVRRLRALLRDASSEVPREAQP